MFLKKVCPKDSVVDFNLCDEKHLCALEFVNHFKYNKPKELLHYFDNGFNMLIDFDIKIKLLDVVKEKKTIDINQKKLNFGDTLRLKPTQIVMNLLNFETVFDKYNVKYKGTMALCPFHNDTNFSLSFSNDKGLWHCFGCELSGNIIQLIKFLEEKNDKRKDLSCDTRK